MKKIDPGQTIQILANVGVIAGIAFLAVELRQNNELLRSSSRQALLDHDLSLVETGMAVGADQFDPGFRQMVYGFRPRCAR